MLPSHPRCPPRRRPPAPEHPTPAPVQCPVCPLTYLDWARLAVHARSHHRDLHICHRADCHLGFHRQADLRAHIRLRHSRLSLPTLTLCFPSTPHLPTPRAPRSDGTSSAVEADVVRLLQALAEGRLQHVALLPDPAASGLLLVRLHAADGAVEAGEAFRPPLRRLRTLSIPSARLPACTAGGLCVGRVDRPPSAEAGRAGCACLHDWRVFERGGMGRASTTGAFEEQEELTDGLGGRHALLAARYDWGYGLTVEEEWAMWDKDFISFSSSPSSSRLSEMSEFGSEEWAALEGLESGARNMLMRIQSRRDDVWRVENSGDESEELGWDAWLNYSGAMW